MGFQSQEPVFVQRARQVASLHMAYQLQYNRPGHGFWAFGAQPQPLSVQAPEPTEQDWHDQQITAVCVTLRYPERWQVRVYLQRTGDGRECWQWKVLRLDSTFVVGGETGESQREGLALYTALVGSYCMRMDDLACTPHSSCSVIPEGGKQRIDCNRYCMANGDLVDHDVSYDLVGDALKRRLPVPAHLSVPPLH